MLHKKNIKKVIATWMAVVVSASCLTVNVSATDVSSANAVDGNVTTDTTTVTPTVAPATETIPNAVDASVMPVATREGDPAKMVAGYSMDPYSYFSEDEWEQYLKLDEQGVLSGAYPYIDSWEVPNMFQENPCYYKRKYSIYMDFTSQAYRKNGKKVKKKLNNNQDTYNNLMKYGLVKGDYIMVDGDVHMERDESYVIAITKEEFDALQNDFRAKCIEKYGEDPMVTQKYISSYELKDQYGFSWDFGKVLIKGSNQINVSKWDTENKIAYGGKPDKIYYYKILYLDRTIKRSDRPDDPHFKGIKFKKDFKESYSIPKEWKIKETVNKDGEYHAKCTIRKTFSARVCISFDMKTYWVDTGVGFPIAGYYSNGDRLENSFHVAYYGKPKLTKWEKSHLKYGKNHDICIYSNVIPQKYKDLMAKRYSRK